MFLARLSEVSVHSVIKAGGVSTSSLKGYQLLTHVERCTTDDGLCREDKSVLMAKIVNIYLVS